MLTTDFDYNLPEERIAKFPPTKRGEAKLLVIDRGSGKLTHRKYSDLKDYFQKGDVGILNNTKVENRKLYFRSSNNARHEVLFLPERSDDEIYKCLISGKRKLIAGEKLFSEENGEFEITLIEKDMFDGIWDVSSSEQDIEQMFLKYGQIPIPPYLGREANNEDKERYNTIFAAEYGSAAAPTATLNLTGEEMKEIRSKGAILDFVTLHVGWGTFAPIRSQHIEKHNIHSEFYSIEKRSADSINIARKRKCKVIAFGTTVSRVLESSSDGNGLIEAQSGNTDLYIYPGYGWKAVDHLVTNFHAPQTSLLTLVASFMGYELMQLAYNEALKADYKFLSYGDSMLII